ncbi:MAG TPA: DNA methyltransferase, partial [Blastocatellia bacterium]|nr:DNA methyltransferase [Blastocatellia bacterium]
SPLVGVVGETGDVLGLRARGGAANDGRAMGSFIEECVRAIPDKARPRQGWTLNDNRGLSRLKASGLAGHPLGKNPGDVWTLPTAGFRGGHFAAFPLALAERPLLATCPERVCSTCGHAWQRGLERQGGRLLAVGELQPTCQCGAKGVPGLVLDPFMGTGTTALAAEKHGRDWLGIELNPAYEAMAEERITTQHQRGKRDLAA